MREERREKGEGRREERGERREERGERREERGEKASDSGWQLIELTASIKEQGQDLTLLTLFPTNSTSFSRPSSSRRDALFSAIRQTQNRPYSVCGLTFVWCLSIFASLLVSEFIESWRSLRTGSLAQKGDAGVGVGESWSYLDGPYAHRVFWEQKARQQLWTSRVYLLQRILGLRTIQGNVSQTF